MNLYVTLGIPGSGKSTWARTCSQQEQAFLATTDPTRTDNVNTVHHLNNLTSRIGQELQAGRHVVVDACNLQTALRRRWLRLGHTHDATCILVVMNTPHHTSITRNLTRPATQQVPAERMQRYIDNWDKALATIRKETWHEVITYQPTEGRTW